MSGDPLFPKVESANIGTFHYGDFARSGLPVDTKILNIFNYRTMLARVGTRTRSLGRIWYRTTSSEIPNTTADYYQFSRVTSSIGVISAILGGVWFIIDSKLDSVESKQISQSELASEQLNNAIEKQSQGIRSHIDLLEEKRMKWEIIQEKKFEQHETVMKSVLEGQSKSLKHHFDDTDKRRMVWEKEQNNARQAWEKEQVKARQHWEEIHHLKIESSMSNRIKALEKN